MIKNPKIRKFLMLDKRRKRTTFLRIFSKAAAVMLAVSAVFAYFSFYFIEMYINEKADREIARTHSNLMQTMNIYSRNGNHNAADAALPPYTYFLLGEPVFYVDSYNLIGGDSYSAAISVLLDKDGNEIASSRRRFMAAISFEKNEKDEKHPENGWYVCKEEEFDIPELKEFYDKYFYMNHFMALSEDEDSDKYVNFILRSAYVNKAEHLFIPHEVTAEYTKAITPKSALTETEVYKTEEFTINADIEGYELVQLHSYAAGESRIYPMVMLPNFQGTEPDVYDEYWNAVKNDVTSHTTDAYSGMYDYRNFPELANKGGGRVYYMTTNYTYNDEECILCTVFAVGIWNPLNQKAYAAMVGIFTAFLLFIALLYSWRKNVMNKADYAFEDYQRDLTNNLAHDLKTPLAAIGGYAENLMESAKDEKQQNYLRSILDNVAYTDSMISKTLELNSGNMQKLNKSGFDMRELAEAALSKYSVQLDERGIESAISGNMKVNTDRDMMTSAVENLVSNAVKYTRNDGEIKIDMNNGKFIITNSDSEKTDTHDLTKPFVRGDKNRSGRSGSGLGLSIAERSLNACGYVLELDCTDSEFTASIR